MRKRVSRLLQLTLLFYCLVSTQPYFASAQTQADRFWLAGRYDQNRIIVYFDAVKLEGTLPTNARKLTPMAADFFEAVEVSPEFVAPFQKSPASEHFALGDRYDLILEDDHIATVTLTTLLGCETDEGVGNDSFIGALATLNEDDLPYFRKDYYALRHHREQQKKTTPEIQSVWVRLEGDPVEFNVQSQLVAQLTDRMKKLATEAQRHRAENTSPVFLARAFRVGDGTLRYYAKAYWRPKKDLDWTSYAVGAWFASSPTIHVLALEKRTCGYEDFECVVPDLLNVLNLDGKTGLIVSTRGDEYSGLSLLEYSDGKDVSQMRTLQTIGAGE